MDHCSSTALEEIEEVLKLLNIVAVVCIDDIYAIDDLDNTLAVAVGWFSKALESDHGPACDELVERVVGESGFFSVPDEVWKRRLGENWQRLESDGRHELLNSLSRLLDLQVDLVEDLRRTSQLRSAIPGAIPLHEMRPLEWNEGRNDVLPESADDGWVLCLFDHNLQCDSASATVDGLQLLDAALEMRDHRPVICALLTHTVQWGEEIERAGELAHQIGRTRADFLVLSKSSLADLAKFADGLKMVSLNHVRDLLTRKTKLLADSASARANEDLMDVNILDFAYMVLESSEQEGLWEADTLFRLFDVFRRRAFLERALDSGSKSALDDDIERLRAIRRVRTISDETHKPRRQRWIVSRLELYDSGGFLNEAHLPLELGDIFEIGSQKFILVEQPCELMVRANGRRVTDTVTLVKITDKASRYSFPLEYFHETTGAPAHAKFRSSYRVSTSLLDLVVFNGEGTCTLDVSAAAPLMLHEPWRKRFDVVRSAFRKHSRRLDELSGALDCASLSTELANHLRKSFVRSITGSNLDVRCEYRQGVFSFAARRVGRYREPHATRLLTSYSSFLARYAQPVDYTPPEEVAPGVTRLRPGAEAPAQLYVGTEHGRRFHRPSCPCAQRTTPDAGLLCFESREVAAQLGRAPCGICRP